MENFPFSYAYAYVYIAPVHNSYAYVDAYAYVVVWTSLYSYRPVELNLVIIYNELTMSSVSDNFSWQKAHSEFSKSAPLL